MVQDIGAGLDEREQAGTKQDASLKNKTDDTKDDNIHAKTANTKAKHKNDKGQDRGVGPDDKEPEEPWPDRYTDHRGPTQDSLHIWDVIDGLTRHPEEAIVRGKGADGSIHKAESEDTKKNSSHAEDFTTKAKHKDNRVQGRGAGQDGKVQGEGAGLDKKTNKDLGTLLQATVYNAKDGFDHREDKPYEEGTAPLRRPLVKDGVFKRDEESETGFQTLRWSPGVPADLHSMSGGTRSPRTRTWPLTGRPGRRGG